MTEDYDDFQKLPRPDSSKDVTWRARYSRLYSSKQLITQKKTEEKPTPISFMSYDAGPLPYTMMGWRSLNSDTTRAAVSEVSDFSDTRLLSPRSEEYSSFMDTRENVGGTDTLLLDMVRARSRELAEEAQDKSLDLPREEPTDDDESMEPCVHRLSIRMTERSGSRSRMSRMSTRRDMDIPSILAFTTNVPAPTHIEIPAFQKINSSESEQVPRWSIRRSVCPVCSQKWKDRSSIDNVKYSGLKRNSAVEWPTVIAPARLRTSITIGYVPRPALAALDEDVGLSHGGLRNTSATWQLTRARRIRTPTPRNPPPEATAPPCTTAPLARRDLDQRVTRFLKDEIVKSVV